MTATEYIVLVDEQNREIGRAEKMAAHEKNQLHRAFSVFIFRKAPQLELLLQQRALVKYHCAGLWTNTCCSHPHPGETIIAAGQRRLKQELGFTAPLTDLGWFHYNAHFDNGLSENEIDHVLIGEMPTGIKPAPHAEEVHALRWITPQALFDEMKLSPATFTPWLAEALNVALDNLPTSLK